MNLNIPRRNQLVNENSIKNFFTRQQKLLFLFVKIEKRLRSHESAC
ncbi:hypothetical protein D347_02913 [Enterococcus faecalis LA3B-2]|nr:hypothetical protein HMPREF9510_01315 [Enterococcus faecalis TX0470]EPI35793.1 hypothetical protein D347_02913 [Enterococcus faecalis LA3B-2]